MAQVRLKKENKTIKVVNRKDTIRLKQVEENIKLQHVGKPGPAGEPGDPGADGKDGLGVPPGGSAGQVLSKVSGDDNDTAWLSFDDNAGGGGESAILLSDGAIDGDATVVIIAGGSDFTIGDPLDGQQTYILNPTGSDITIAGNVNGDPNASFLLPGDQAVTLLLGMDASDFGAGLTWQITPVAQRSGILDVSAGDNVSIDKTDPQNPIISAVGGAGYTQRSQTIMDDTEILQDTTYVYIASEGTTIEDPLVDGHVIVVSNLADGTITGNIYGQPDYAFPMSPGTYLFCALDLTSLGMEVVTWIPVPTTLVSSVNGKMGDITLTATDVGAARNLGWRIVGHGEQFTTLAAAMSYNDGSLSNFIYVKQGYYNEPAYTNTNNQSFTIISDRSYHVLEGDWDLGYSAFNAKGLGITGGGQYSVNILSNIAPYSSLYDCSFTGMLEFNTLHLTISNSQIHMETWNSYRSRLYSCYVRANVGEDNGIIATGWFSAKDSQIIGGGGDFELFPVLKTNFSSPYDFVSIDSCETIGLSVQSGTITNSYIGEMFGVEITDQTGSVVFANNTLGFVSPYGNRGVSLRATGDGTHNIVIDGNEFKNDTAVGVANAIVNVSANNAKITNNHIYTTSKSPAISGILVTGDRNIVSNNTIKTISTGITIASGTNNIITQNVTTDVGTAITDGGATTVLANNVT